MRRLFLPMVLVLAFVVVGPAQAATVNVSIRSTSFSPSTVNLNHDDSITWKNNDKTNHQVVANDGSFASPILGPGKSYTHTFSAAGTFHYHDAIKTSLKGVVTVKGPPPSVAFALSVPIVYYGTDIALSGQISNHKAGQNVTLTAQEYGQVSPVVLATVVTGAGGTFGYSTTPKQYTTYLAKWGNTTSAPIIAQVAPKLTLLPTRNGYMKAQITGGRSFYHRHLFLQRMSIYGQWVNIAPLTLGPLSGRIFQPGPLLPAGTSKIRVFLTVNQAGIGLLASNSGTQVVHKKA